MSTAEQRYERCLVGLRARKQDHALRWWSELTSDQRDTLLGEIKAIPWSVLDPILPTHVLSKPKSEVPANLEPASVYRPSARNSLSRFRFRFRPARRPIQSARIQSLRTCSASFTASRSSANEASMALANAGRSGTTSQSPIKPK